jgi:protoporphyrin/coproporphyrin ferrochelatase
MEATLTSRGVLVMAYGTPADLDHVEEYYRDILHGRSPPAELVAALTDRYRAIGGSPLLQITKAQVEGIAARLEGVRAYLGQKHAAPFIPDAVRAIAADGIDDVVGLVLAPHYSQMSIGDYASRARRAAQDAGWTGELRLVESWHLEEGYLKFLVREVKVALAGLDDAVVIFTAHSLPARIADAGDPYPEQLRATARAVAQRIGLERWEVGWQSAGQTAEPWLGPDITEILPVLAHEGVSGVVVCPCGFVADHLEVLYDVDIEARRVADSLGLQLARTRMPNDDPDFLDTVAAVVLRRFERS